jgi:hypothetical protein
MPAYHGFNQSEVALIKQTFLVFFSDTTDYPQAIRATGVALTLDEKAFTLKTVARFRKEDAEFDKNIMAIEIADDLELLSMARDNIRQLLKWRDEKTGKPDARVTIWIESSRGGYSERAKDGKKANSESIHPFNPSVVQGKVANGDS